MKKIVKQGVKVNILGKNKMLPRDIIKTLRLIEKRTLKNKIVTINFALNYGSKEEIINTVKKLNKSSIKINEKNISENLYTKNIPDPEILVRTGNRNRLSNFLLWQLSYTEIYFVRKLWPDFTRKDFSKIITNFSKVKRNFGGIK